MARLLVLFAFLFPFAPLTAHAAPGPAAELDAYVSAYYLAEGKLADFDAEIGASHGSGVLRRSQTYKELLALRMILETKARAINEDLTHRDSRELSLFRSRLDALGPVERIAITNLLPDLAKAPVDLPVFYATLEQELAARAAARDLMRARTALARADAALNAQVSALAATLDFGRARDERAVSVIKPGAGPEGTISGSSFPANTWALTYDDGPHDKYTPQIFANLTELKKKASFMWLVECLEENKTLPAQAQALGLSINNHSWTHANLDKAKTEELTKEVSTSTEKDSQLYGEKPRFFRLPYGAGLSNKSVRQLIADNGLIHVFWNVDSLDWQDKNPDTILARVKKEMNAEKHGIILFHDIHPQSVAASKLVLQWSATLTGANAHRWVTIPQIVDEMNHH